MLIADMRIDFISEISDIRQIKEYIKELLNDIKSIPVSVTARKLEKFCRYIYENNPIYWDEKHSESIGYPNPLVPPGYLPTLITPIINKIFLSKLPKMVKGIIHVSSKITYLKPIFANTSYATTIALKDISEKEGKMGSYIQTDFIVTLKDEKGEDIAKDWHIFFLKK
ncbi:MAG: FAS1-like dehydratase domain-containing protein [Candidatus Helarchaeota archaeon]